MTTKSKSPDYTPQQAWIDTGLGKLPPQDIESEDELLSHLLARPKDLYSVRAILTDGNFFYSENRQRIYAAILSVSEQGKDLRPLTVIQYLSSIPGDKPENQLALHLLRELSMRLTTCDAVTTALHLRELYIKRVLIAGSSEILRSCYNNDTLDEVIGVSVAINERTMGLTTIATSKGIAHYTRTALSEIEAASKAPAGLVGINTGLGKINKITGGWRKKKLVIIGGRPGSGKTGVAVFHAKAAAETGTPVAILSAEMPYEELVTRMISSECNIPYEDLGKGKYKHIPQGRQSREFTDQDWSAIHKAAGKVEQLPIFLYEGIDYEISSVVYWLREMHRKHGVGLAIIDYIQLLADRTIKNNPVAEITAISRQLKIVSGIMPVIALSQLSREVDSRPNKRPVQTDLRGSGGLEQDADLIVMLYRDDYYKMRRAKDEAANGSMFVMPHFDNNLDYDIIKYRGGEPAMARLYIDIGCNRIADEHPLSFVVTQVPPDQKYLNNYSSDSAKSFAEPIREGEEGF